MAVVGRQQHGILSEIRPLFLSMNISRKPTLAKFEGNRFVAAPHRNNGSWITSESCSYLPLECSVVGTEISRDEKSSPSNFCLSVIANAMMGSKLRGVENNKQTT